MLLPEGEQLRGEDGWHEETKKEEPRNGQVGYVLQRERRGRGGGGGGGREGEGGGEGEGEGGEREGERKGGWMDRVRFCSRDWLTRKNNRYTCIRGSLKPRPSSPRFYLAAMDKSGQGRPGFEATSEGPRPCNTGCMR